MFLYFFIIIFLAQNQNFPLACMTSAAGMVISSSSVINHYPCVVFTIHFFAHNIHARDKICNILQGKKQKKHSKLYKKMGLLQNCFPVSAATDLINISLKTIHASGFRCAPEERGITAYGLAHRLWIYPRFCALQERGSGLTVASLPHFMCRRHFRIPHSAFRIPRACFTLKK